MCSKSRSTVSLRPDPTELNMHFFRYRRYRGFIGAVMDFEMHPTYRLIASVGLGRTVVLHRMKQPGIPLWRKYLKQKVCSSAHVLSVQT